MKNEFDLIVIGTGGAGSTAAYKCRSAGWEVAIIDSRPPGGTCQLRGCNPKKVLVSAAAAADWHNRMQGKGVSPNGARIDWPALIRFKNEFTDPVPENMEEGYAEAGIALLHGRARFVNKTTLQVGEQRLTGRYVLIASGARPATLNIPGEEYLTTSEQFLALEQLPQRIVFVGGGYISFEFAHVAARAGAQACMFHRGPRPLRRFDPDLVAHVVQATRELGVDVRLHSEVTRIEQSANHLVVVAATPEGEQRFEADMAVHGAGRVPAIDDLHLEQARVKREPEGVAVNEYLQSISNPQVYAAADVAASGLPLSPVAGMEGGVVASNLLEGNHHNADYTGVPTVLFTVPPLAQVGLGEEAAREQGLKFRVNHQATADWFSSRQVNMKHTGFKVLVEEESGRVLGAHLLGPHAEEVINLFALAVRLGLRAADLKQVVYAYPTSASDIGSML